MFRKEAFEKQFIECNNINEHDPIELVCIFNKIYTTLDNSISKEDRLKLANAIIKLITVT